MDKKFERPQGDDSNSLRSGITVEDAIRAVKESAEEVEKFVLKIKQLRSAPVLVSDSKIA